MQPIEIVNREVIATRFQTRDAAQSLADLLNEQEGVYYTVSFRDHDWYSIIVRNTDGTFLGYVKIN